MVSSDPGNGLTNLLADAARSVFDGAQTIAGGAAQNVLTALKNPTVNTLPPGAPANAGYDPATGFTIGVPVGPPGQSGGVNTTTAAVINEAKGALANKVQKKVTRYLTAGTFTHTWQPGLVDFEVDGIGGGGGGGGGAFLTGSGSGGAGGGGGYRPPRARFLAAILAGATTTSVTVGAGGLKGTGATSSVAATAGANGTSSTVGTFYSAPSGGFGAVGATGAVATGGGAGGLTASNGSQGGTGAASGVSAGNATANSLGGGPGAGSTATGTAGTGATAQNGGSGGAGGGGINNGVAQPGAPGARAAGSPTISPAAGAVPGGNAGTVADPANPVPGSGGGGGAGSTTTNGGAGSDGQKYGAGGGGGGSTNFAGGKAGDGGNGSSGFVEIVEYYVVASALADVTTGGGLPAGLQAADALSKAAKIDASATVLAAQNRALISTNDFASSRGSGFHACALGLATSVADGQPIRFVTVRSIYGAAGMTFRAQFYRRPINSAQWTVGPPAIDDTLLYTINVDPAAQGLKPTINVSQEVIFDLGENYFRDPGTDLIIVLTAYDNTGAQIGAYAVTEATTAATDQALRGWYRALGANVWTPRPAGLTLKLRVETAAAAQPLKAYAEASAMSATDRLIYGWIERTRGGLVGPAPIPGRFFPGRHPGGSTPGEGLAKLIAGAGATAWPADQMQQGVDFGRTAARAAAADGSTHPAWDATNNRLLMRDNSVAAKRVVDNYAVKGFVNLTSGAGGNVTVTDSTFDAQDTFPDGFYQQSPERGVIAVSRSEFTRGANRAIYVTEGVVDRCLFVDTKADGFWFEGTRPKRLMRSFIHGLGRRNPETHADCVQTGVGIDNRDFISFGNTMYMPFTGGRFDEGTYGSTNVLNYNTQHFAPPAVTSSDFVNVNDVLIGGGYTVNLVADPGDIVNGMTFVGCWFSRPPTNAAEAQLANVRYVGYGSFYSGAPQIGTTRNILIHNCRYLEDGSPVSRFDSTANYARTDLNGLWEYDKASAPPHFLRIAKMLGYLDDNGDPLVPVRYGFHAGAVS